MSGSPLVSLGYEGRTVDELLQQLQEEAVALLVDVRLTPLSRKPGLSKRRLAATLETAGIRYVHLRALGNPKDNRAPLRAGEPGSYDHFRALITDGPGLEALRHVAEMLERETVALLCIERDHDSCHRHLVAEELQRAKPALCLVEC